MKYTKICVALSLFCALGAANAALVQNGNGTFSDTSTGYQWQDISTFWNVDTSQMATLLKPGFHFASLSELNSLQLAAPAIPGNFVSDVAAMGVPNPTTLNRNLIWGVYGDLSQWSWKFDYDAQWNFNPIGGVTQYADMGAFAVNTQAVPEPETYAMLLAGLGVMGAVARRRKAKQA